MFEPKYAVSPKLLGNIKRITTLVAELNRISPDKTAMVALEKEARELSAYSSTGIEGNPLPLTEVKKILKTRPQNIRDTEREVLNYNHALGEINRRLRRGKIALNLPLILKIQKQVTAGLIEKYRCGRLRREPVFVNNPATGKTIYWPPDHQDVRSLMAGLLSFINKNQNELDPLILAGIFHKQFVIIHPFIDGNGRTARLTTKVLLASLGLNLFNLFSFENYYNRNVGKYFAQVGVLGDYYDLAKKINFTGWLEYFTDGIIDELLRVTKEFRAVGLTPETALKTQHRQVLDYLKDHSYITDRDYAVLTSRSKAARNKDFNKLISLGLVEKKGKGKSTYYKLKW